jgi:hypothetical protein
VRIQAFRAHFMRAMQTSLGAARRAGHAISKKVKATLAQIDLSVGVGDDESSFGQGGNRAWYELALEEARRRLLVLFEKSGFDRHFPRFEKFVRRVLGNPAGPPKSAPQIQAPPSERKTVAKVKARTQDEVEAERLRAEVRRSIMMAHQREGAGLRERIATHRKGKDGEDPEGEDHS